MVDSPTPTSTTTTKPKRGRPKNAERKPVHEGRRFADDGRNLITRNGRTFEFVPDDAPDRLHVPAHMIPEGMVYLWVTDSILGQPQPQWRRRREQAGWKPVPAVRHDGVWMPKGYEGEINVDGLVLCELPVEFVERRKRKDSLNAAEQVYVRERALMSGDAVGENIGFDATSEKGRKANRLDKRYEAIPVPGNSYQRED